MRYSKIDIANWIGVIHGHFEKKIKIRREKKFIKQLGQLCYTVD